MPPRKRPATSGPSNGVSPANIAVHVPGFVHYLQAECGLSENTVLAYRTDLDQFSEWFALHGPALVQQVELSHFLDFLEELRLRQLAPSSVGRKLIAIRMFFRYLLVEGIISESKAELLNSPKLNQHLPKVLSPDMVNRLINAPSREDRWPLRDRALLALMYATGCRASEVCGIGLRDIQLEEGYCRCLGKGNKERLVSLNPVARAAIEAYLVGERPKLAASSHEGPLLLSRRREPLTRNTVWKLVKRYARRIGASDEVSPHTLRHSFATHMLAGGAEIRSLQELLGHASIRTTQIYTQVEHSRLKNIHEQCHPRG